MSTKLNPGPSQQWVPLLCLLIALLHSTVLHAYRDLQNEFAVVLISGLENNRSVDDFAVCLEKSRLEKIQNQELQACRLVNGDKYRSLASRLVSGQKNHDVRIGKHFLIDSIFPHHYLAAERCSEIKTQGCEVVFLGLRSDYRVPIEKLAPTQTLRYFLKFTKLSLAGDSAGFIVPPLDSATVPLFRELSFTNKVGALGALVDCEITEDHLLVEGKARVVCNKNQKGYVDFAYLAHSQSIDIAKNKRAVVVRWQERCGGDSCGVTGWLVHRDGWRRQLSDDHKDSVLSPDAVWLAFSKNQSGATVPRAPQLWLENMRTGERKYLAEGASPQFHPSGRFLAYRTADGSVGTVGTDGRNPKIIFRSPYTAKQMSYIMTVDTVYQPEVKFGKNSRIRVVFQTFKEGPGFEEEPVIKKEVTIKLPKNLKY